MFKLDYSCIVDEILERGYCVRDIENSTGLYDNVRGEAIGLQERLVAKASTSKFSREELGNVEGIQKYAVGPQNGSGENIAQFLITTYLGEISKTAPTLQKVSQELVRIRNILTDLDPKFGNNVTDGFWNALRIHHYPAGAGFMQRHRDQGFPEALEKCGIRYLQVSTCLSVKGEDFHGGGGYVVDRRTGVKQYTDVPQRVIRLVFFDGSCEHGVDVPSPGVSMTLDGSKGRLALFSNLYKVI